MSSYCEEAAMAHGADNPSWRVSFQEGLTGDVRHIDVSATDYQEAVNKATDRLNRDPLKPAGTYLFTRCAPGQPELPETTQACG